MRRIHSSETLDDLQFLFDIFLAFLPALVYFLAVIRVKEGHVVMLYQSTVTVIVVRLLFIRTLPGSDGPQHMYGLDTLCLLFATTSAAVLYKKGTPKCVNDYVTSAFASGGESTRQRWMQFYSVVLVYVGFCPFLFLILAYDTEGCCPEMASMGAGFLMIYAMVCTICTAFESLRKSACNAADASADLKRELDRHMHEVAPEEERESLI